jgi:hypothetical protein
MAHLKRSRMAILIGMLRVLVLERPHGCFAHQNLRAEGATAISPVIRS